MTAPEGFTACANFAAELKVAAGSALTLTRQLREDERAILKDKASPTRPGARGSVLELIARKRDRIGGNPGMKPMVRAYDKFAPAEQKRIAENAASILAGP